MRNIISLLGKERSVLKAAKGKGDIQVGGFGGKESASRAMIGCWVRCHDHDKLPSCFPRGSR